MHLNEADLQALLDGALEPADAAGLRAHLAGCPECAAHAAEIEATVRFVGDALDALDPGPVPDLAADDVITRAAAGRPERGARFLRAAAVALLLAAAGGVAAWPGSPVRQATVRLVEGLRSPTGPTASEPEPAASEVALEPAVWLVVTFAAPQAEGAIEFELASTGPARVRATDPAVSFSVGSDSIAVENAGSGGSYRVSVPRGLARVEIRVGGAVVLSIAGDQVRSSAPLVDGRATLPFSAID